MGLNLFSSAKTCQKAFFPSGDSFVCVCNSTHCDQVEGSDIRNLTNVFHVFTSSKTGDRLKKRQYEFSSTANKTGNPAYCIYLNFFFLLKMAQ